MRTDIQFLRGLAVLSVVFYHADILPIKGGYLGVDTFFVISGYLITSVILRDVDERSFSFTGFYIRRAKRLLPAAYCTMFLTTIGAYFVLEKNQTDDYIKQLLGMLFFSSNIVLPFQTGYFEGSAESKPLLHTWSLSVEEQYYLITPCLLLLTPGGWRTRVLSLIIFISLVTCVIAASINFRYWRFPDIDFKTLAFFLLPTRAWELCAGSLLACLSRKAPAFNVSKHAKIVGLIVMATLFVFPVDSVHPRVDAVLVVALTMLMIFGDRNWLPNNLITRCLAYIGDLSYSLYLVHWPIFSFAHVIYLGNTPVYVKTLLVFASLGVAKLQYELVEQRFRYRWKDGFVKTAMGLAAASLIIVMAPAFEVWYLKYLNDTPEFAMKRDSKLSLNEACNEGRFPPLSVCVTSPSPQFALWGDSFAIHLVPGLLADTKIQSSLVQITKPACSPILGIADLDSLHNAAWAEGCLVFNQNSFSFIRDSDSIKYVIMSSPFGGIFEYDNNNIFYEGHSLDTDRSLAIQQMIKTIEGLKAAGKQPIIVSPPPLTGFDIGNCWERKAAGLITLGRSDCSIQRAEYVSYQRGINDALKDIQIRTGIDVVFLDEYMCDKKECITTIDGISVYRDVGHLTRFASQWVAGQIKLSDRVMNQRH